MCDIFALLLHQIKNYNNVNSALRIIGLRREDNSIRCVDSAMNYILGHDDWTMVENKWNVGQKILLK